MSAGYDNAAWFYDALSRMVLGKAPLEAQSYFLNQIPPGSSVLIAGGGTGKILEKLNHPQHGQLKITYVELSPKMMHQAKKRRTGDNRVGFVLMPIQDFTGEPFDVVITPFLLDSIPAKEFEYVFSHLNGLLRPGGFWLNTDFQLLGMWWQKQLLKLMYLFFKVMKCVDVTKLPPINEMFNMHQFKLLDVKTFHAQFIAAQVWWKTSP